MLSILQFEAILSGLQYNKTYSYKNKKYKNKIKMIRRLKQTKKTTTLIWIPIHTGRGESSEILDGALLEKAAILINPCPCN